MKVSNNLKRGIILVFDVFKSMEHIGYPTIYVNWQIGVKYETLSHQISRGLMANCPLRKNENLVFLFFFYHVRTSSVPIGQTEMWFINIKIYIFGKRTIIK